MKKRTKWLLGSLAAVSVIGYAYANVNSVGITSGVPTSGTGTVSTLDALMADGGMVTIGAKADAKSTATDTTAITAMSVWKQISASIQAAAASLVTIATNTGAAIPAGSAIIGQVGIDQTTPGTTNKVVASVASGGIASGAIASGAIASGAVASGAVASGAIASGALASGSIAAGAMVDVGAQADSACSTDNGTCTLIALTKRNNQRLTTVNSSIGAANAYETVAASQTAQALGATGATGDYLSHCVIYPTTTTPGVVTVFDNSSGASTNVIAFPGGASSVSNLAPITLPVGAVSTAGAWKVTTGANLVVTCYGRFT